MNINKKCDILSSAEERTRLDVLIQLRYEQFWLYEGARRVERILHGTLNVYLAIHVLENVTAVAHFAISVQDEPDSGRGLEEMELVGVGGIAEECILAARTR